MIPGRSAPTFWTTLRLLLGVARARSAGRRKRQQELLQNRAGKKSTDWSRFGYVVGIFFMLVLNVLAVFVLKTAVDTGAGLEAERQGKIIVSHVFLNEVRTAEEAAAETETEKEDSLNRIDYSSEAERLAERYGGTSAAIEKKLRNSVDTYGARDLITRDDVSSGFSTALQLNSLPALLGSLALFWWGVMLVFQGEGLELDIQRRRHPMWEFLFAHPVPPGAVFLAEMLSPIAANPIYWGAPLYVGTLYGFVYDAELGLLAAVLVGIPIAIAAACLGKALEIAVTLRLPPRSRGAVMGLMGWLGYASMMLLFVGLVALPKIITALAGFFSYLTVVPWPWLRLFLGGHSDGTFSFALGACTCWLASILVVTGSIWFSVWATNRGLAGNFASDSRPVASAKSAGRFGKDPLYRKEFLWFVRDRSAIVQTILIPLTVAGMQIFNLRGILSYAEGAWNYLCGVAILFGTYFLWILGPKSLLSEGPALWIALTWPRGLESLLKAKAWLWSLISSGMVALVLCYTAFLFPADLWKVGLVAIGWFFFSRSMAEKTVTLVTVTSSSGEREPIPKSRHWAAQLGMLTFAIGILTQQWNLAIVGIVYSFLTAAAMWQNFRARLPFLYDPWSEKLPPPPTLMHAMIAISILVEGAAVLSGIVLAIVGRDNIALAQAVSYAISSVLVAVGVWYFLDNRDVSLHDVWVWKPTTRNAGTGNLRSTNIFLALLIAAAGGLALGLFATGYLAVLQHIPAAAELLRKSQEQMARIPNFKLYYGIMAIGLAPFAEEYLFRGLLYRALDREWGGWRAILGSAAFFAIYHPVTSWLPVVLLGATNAILFKKSGRLAPAVLLHMVYNAFVLR